MGGGSFEINLTAAQLLDPSRADPMNASPAFGPQAGGPELRGAQPESWRWALGLVILCVSGMGLLTAQLANLIPRTEYWAVLTDDTLRGVLALLAGFACRRRGRALDDVYAPAWRAFGAYLLWFGVTTVYLIVMGDLYSPTTKPPQWRHVGYLVAFAYLAKAVLLWPTIPGLRSQRLQTFLDGLLIAVASLFLGWDVVLRGLMQVNAGFLPLMFLMIYPALSITITVAWFIQESRRARPYALAPLTLLRAALLLGLSEWVLAAQLAQHGSSGVFGPSEILDMLAHLSMLCFGLAALWPQGNRRIEPVTAGHSRLELALPFVLPMLVAVYAADQVLMGHPPDSAMAITGVLLGGLLCLRQYLALRDVRELSQTLESRVEERTRALEESQAVVLRTQRMNMVATLGAGLVHDFKNLLNIIRGMSAVVQMDVDRGSAPNSEDLVAIQSAATQADDMAGHLMTLGRQLEHEIQSFDLGEQVLEFHPILKRLVPSNITVTLEPEPVLLPIKGDPLQIQQILVNLVSNARDAMPAGGSIRILTGLRVSETTPLQAELRVMDDGSGMPSEILARIFDPFFTTKDPGKGTGLGLASVKAIVEGSGGTLQAQSEPGKGTTFRLAFPLVTA